MHIELCTLNVPANNSKLLLLPTVLGWYRCDILKLDLAIRFQEYKFKHMLILLRYIMAQKSLETTPQVRIQSIFFMGLLYMQNAPQSVTFKNKETEQKKRKRHTGSQKKNSMQPVTIGKLLIVSHFI